MYKNRFRSYDLAVAFYTKSRSIKLPGYVNNQFFRASLSIALNLREGRGRHTLADQLRFFHIAMGSTREVQAIVELHPDAFNSELATLLDRLAAAIYLLIKRAR
jgi:four helix bundle protein